jgi:hypothetical protein
MRVNALKLKKDIKNTTIILFVLAAGFGVLLSVGLIPWSVFAKFPSWLIYIIAICYCFSILISIDNND